MGGGGGGGGDGVFFPLKVAFLPLIQAAQLISLGMSQQIKLTRRSPVQHCELRPGSTTRFHGENRFDLNLEVSKLLH